MADARDDNTRLICTTEPICLCADINSCSVNEYECDCSAGDLGAQCAGCEAPMKRIDVDTGEDVPA